MTVAMILAAGFGSRLGSLSDERPKPLLPVCDSPLIDHAVALLVGHGIRDIVVNLHHLGERIASELGDGSRLGARIRYSRETTILGTGGGIRHALPLLGSEPFIVMNGKVILEIDLHDLLAQHRQSGAQATLVVRREASATTWNAIAAPRGGGRITDIFGAGEHMFTGLQVLEPALVARLPDDAAGPGEGGGRCIIRQGHLPWLRAGVHLHAYEQAGYFMEHSTPARYLAGNVNVLRGKVRIPYPPAPLGGVDPRAILEPGVTIVEPVRVGPAARLGAGCVIGPDAVIGTAAVVAAGVRVKDSVVWPGVVVDRDAEHEILAATTRIDASASDGKILGP
jgi:NDP-sugar pyrophosphorylase family protein